MSKFMHCVLLFRSRVLILTTLAVFVLPGYGQSSTGESRVTLNLKNTPLKKVFSEITKQTKLYFLGNSDKLNQNERYTIKAENETVNTVLKQLLGGKGFIWTIKDNTVLIQKFTESSTTKAGEPLLANVADSLITVSGKVLNERNEPIIGATLVFKGTTVGAKTNQKGEFEIAGIRRNSKLIISSIAYLTKEIVVKGKGNLGSISLKDYIGLLDETQIIAYGKTSRRYNTGNVTTIKAVDIGKQPVGNVLLALSGRVPGLQITQESGFSGGGVTTLIQGQNSILKGSDPFIVIDGMPYPSQLLPNLANVLRTSGRGTNGPATGNPLSFLNPGDIESIEILKDADATAIYGSRAANGAILITTKKGKPGKTKVDFNLSSGVGEVARKMNLLKTNEYIQMRKEAFANDGIDYNDPTMAYAPDLTFWNQNKNTDWQKELLGKSSNYNNAQLTISGGNENTQFLIGTAYHRENTIFSDKLNDKKASFNFNINNISANKKFKTTFSGSYIFDQNKLPTVDLTEAAMNISPNAPNLYNKDGSINWEPNSTGVSTWGQSQPIALLVNRYEAKTRNLLGNASLSYEIIDGLELKSSFGYSNFASDEFSTFLPTSAPPEIRQYYTRKAYYGNNSTESYIIEPQISYLKAISKGQISFLLGSTIQQTKNSRKLLEGSGYNSDYVLDNINAATTVKVPPNSTIVSLYRYNALFARINYNLENKYIVNLTARRDGSSRFGSENQFNNFGALGVAWIFSNNSLIQQNLNFLSFGKLRASYGTTGNDQIGDYQFMSLYDNYNTPVPYRGGSSLVSNNHSNHFLQWEETKKLSIGLDLGFLKDRILMNINYNRNRSSNQLLSKGLPTISGPAVIVINLPATVQNTGFDISLNTVNISGTHFRWSTNLNLTIPKNKLISFKDLAESTAYADIYKVGSSINVIRTYKFSGLNPNTGVFEFIDNTGKRTSDPGFGVENKLEFINPDQKFYGGIQNSISYHNFDLDFLFQFVKQRGQNYAFGSGAPAGYGPNVNQSDAVLDHWKKAGDNRQYQKYTTNDIGVLLGNIYAVQSNAAWGDASYIRLKNVSFSWTLPHQMQSSLKLQNARLYLQGQNLLTITNYIGLDPETRSTLSLPPLRVITFGIQVTI